jgi:tRNA(Glu) U13 pseudouridine synthase TruD
MDFVEGVLRTFKGQHRKKEDIQVADSKEEQVYVRVKDLAGNEFVCPIDALKGLKEVPEDVLDNCVDDATVGRYAGNIKIKD